jgi:hypothetical protein
MRTLIAPGHNRARTTALVAAALAFVAASSGRADQPKQGPPRAPGDQSIIDSDPFGSYFVTKPLKEKYDKLLKRVGELRADIDEARIDESKARREIIQLQSEIDATLREIDKTKLYVPGAIVQRRAVTKHFPLNAGDLLLVEAEEVEIRGGTGPEIECVVQKTVLGEFNKAPDMAADFDGIEVVVGKSSRNEKFGFYKTAAGRSDLKAMYDQFPFKPFLDREFAVVTIKGLTGEEGNRQIRLESLSEQGEGQVGSVWCRHAKLILTVPKCQGVAVQGALGGFRVHSLNAPLMVQGAGNRDYQAHFEVTNLVGPLVASGVPIHTIDGVNGDVSIVATDYSEDIHTQHGPDGITMRSVGPQETVYKGIQGSLRARFCRAQLTLAEIGGRVDVQNDFGKTVWRSVGPIAELDHRIVSQSGAISVQLAPTALGKLRLELFTECGAVRLPKGENGLQSLMFHGNTGDVTSRSWHGYFSGGADDRFSGSSPSLSGRLTAAVRGDQRPPGIDIISRAGTVTYEPSADLGHRHEH